MDKDRLTCTKADYARRKGVSPPAISAAIRNGRIVVLDNGLVDIEASDVAWSQRTNALQSSRANSKKRRHVAVLADELSRKESTPSSPSLAETIASYEVSKAKTEYHKARITEMDERKRAGELCEVNDVKKVLTSVAVNFRFALERMADKLSERIAAETDPHACHKIISEEAGMILSQVCQEFEAAAIQLEEDAKNDQ